jgi:hypothetical protein
MNLVAPPHPPQRGASTSVSMVIAFSGVMIGKRQSCCQAVRIFTRAEATGAERTASNDAHRMQTRTAMTRVRIVHTTTRLAAYAV